MANASRQSRPDSTATGWQLLIDASAPAEQVWLRLPRTAEAEVRAVLFGCEAGAPLAGSVPPTATGEPGLADALACDAWMALLGGLRDLLAPPGALRPEVGPLAQFHPAAWVAAAAACQHPWSGALEFDLPLLGEAHNDPFRVLIGGQRVAAMRAGDQRVTPAATQACAAAGQPSLASLRQALARHPVALTARLDAVELSLGDLRGLRPGDVIPLPHLLDRPLAVHSTDGAALCHAWLGRNGERRALQLVSSIEPHPPSRSTP